MTAPNKFLPFALPLIGREEIREVLDTLRSGWLTTGPKTRRFEEDFKAYTGAKHAVALNSCTAALNLTLTAFGVGPGDEVITTTLTFAATGNMIAMLGAKPVLADIEPDHLTIDLRDVERKTTRRTKGIIAVHYAGHPCDMKGINAFAKKRGLFVIEDAAHAVGTKYNGAMIGSGGNPACFSFYPIKNMTTGEGGMVTTNSAALADKIRILSLHGIDKDAWKRYSREGSWFYQITACGNKYNMLDMQAALGIVQLRRLEEFIAIRERYAAYYRKALAGLPGITLPALPAKNVRHSLHLFPILVNPRVLGIDRNTFIEELKKRNIGTSVHFIPLHLHPFYRDTFGYRPGDFPVAEEIYSRILSLPLYPKMTQRDLARAAAAVRDIDVTFRKAGGK